MMRIRSPSSMNVIGRACTRHQQQRLSLGSVEPSGHRNKGRCGQASARSSSSQRDRSYLERWAGIRDGGSAAGSGENEGAPSSSTSIPPVTFFGRTYLLTTVKVPPFPPPPPPATRLGPASPTTPTPTTPTRQTVNGSAVQATGREGCQEGEEMEEERVFEWMREALNRPGGLGSTGFFPARGSSVVLDLGAVSQDGSPHGRPAGRASVAGAARAVRAAGLVPVGVCNTSHDVLGLALELGLPEVMMVQARPRSARQSSAPVTASTIRAPAPPPRQHSSLAQERPSSGDRSSGDDAVAPACGGGGSGGGGVGDGDNCSPREVRSGEQRRQQDSKPERKGAAAVAEAAAAAEQPVEVREAVVDDAPTVLAQSGAAASGTGSSSAAGADQEDRDSADGNGLHGGGGCDRGGGGSSSGGLADLGEREADRETMVYQGSVRSGQQVFAEGTSLVVLGAVSSGGEVMADGDIHVYGALRGRALAGLSGNKSAKIFATRFDAELVMIHDAFATCDDPENLPGLVVDAPTNVCLRDDELVFRSFDLPT